MSGLIFGGILLGSLLLAVLWPALQRVLPEVAGGGPDSPLARLIREKDRRVEALADLDFELAQGKMDADEHGRMRSELLEEATGLLEEIEAFEGPVNPDCAACGKVTPDDASFCPHCGEKL